MELEESSLSQTILQNYSNQILMILAQKQTCRSMEQDRKQRNKFTPLWSVKLQKKRKEYIMEKRQFLQ